MTYILGAAVAVVWGVIVYRIVAAVKASDDEGVSPPIVKISNEPYNDFATKADTTRLLLNYRDPFGMVKPKDTVENPVIKQYKKEPAIIKPMTNWDFIQYCGYMLNPSTKKLVTLININGKNEMFTDGATLENVKLIKNMRDSIKISYNGMVKFIPRKNSQ